MQGRARLPLILLLAWTLLPARVATGQDRMMALLVMLESSDSDERASAARELGKIGPAAKEAIRPLIKLLVDPDWWVRQQAAKAFKGIGPACISPLVKALKNRNPSMRIAVAEVLKGFGGQASTELKALMPHLRDSEAEVRDAIADTLGKFGSPAIPGLMRVVGYRKPGPRYAAARALAKIGPQSIPPLRGALKAKSTALRAGAARALGGIGPGAQIALPELIAAMAGSGEEARIEAMLAGGRIGRDAPRTLPPLVGAMEDPALSIRAAAVEAAFLFGKDGAPHLLQSLDGAADVVRDGCIQALARIGKDAVDPVTGGLESPSPHIRGGAAEVLGRMDPLVRVAAGDVAALLDDKEPAVRRSAAIGLAGCGRASKKSRAALRRRLAVEAVPEVRAAVATAVGAAADGTDDILETLGEASKDDSAQVRIAAAGARWRLTNEPGPALALLRKSLNDPALARDARREALLALATMGRKGAPALPDLLALLEGGDDTETVVNTLGAIIAAHGVGLLGRQTRYRSAPAASRRVIEAGLKWLAAHQDTEASGVNDADGRWHPTDFVKHHPPDRMKGKGIDHYSGGVTGLALSAYLAAGYTDRGSENPYAKNVREGLAFLMQRQQSSGCMSETRSQHFLIDHAVATVAMCEAWILTGDPRYGRCAQWALDFCCATRNPSFGWRYEPRGGENDTNVTSNMLTAIRLGGLGGLDVDPEAYRGAGDWIVRMTDPQFGQVGYNMPGGSCARPEGLQDRFPPEKSQAMTAAGLWCRILIGPPLVDALQFGRGIDLCKELYPVWDRRAGTNDMYYWHFGTLVFWQQKPAVWERWRRSIERALFGNQRGEEKSAYAGSWDPCGPWGGDGGRVYSTALNLLTLATPYRFERGFMDEPRLPKEYGPAVSAIKRIAKDKKGPAAARTAAAGWLERVYRR
ncbi:MAG: HEAT repeat domain-containing protein [Planctomycetota bacterium]|jgi:HEAT repeat protein